MKISKLILAIMAVVTMAACKKEYTVVEPDMHHGSSDMHYAIAIMKPDTSMKMMDSTMHIHVRFTEKDNKTVHHVKVKIYQTDNPSNVIYDMPTDAHVHATNGQYDHHDDLVLSASNGVVGHKNYTLEAKVWGHEVGKHEVTVTRGFHIHKM